MLWIKQCISPYTGVPAEVLWSGKANSEYVSSLAKIIVAPFKVEGVQCNQLARLLMGFLKR